MVRKELDGSESQMITMSRFAAVAIASPSGQDSIGEDSDIRRYNSDKEETTLSV